MNTQEYQRLYEVENVYWWHIGRQRIIERLIEFYFKEAKDLEILDAGCGCGGNYKMLQKFGHILGIDNSENSLNFCQKNNFNNVLLTDCCQTKLKDNTYDLIVALDLLEHLESDKAAINEFHRLLKEDGKLIITVPAYQFIWSNHDESLHHKRRYKIKQIYSLLQDNSFSVIKGSYAITFLAPPIIIFRLVENLIKKVFNYRIIKKSYFYLPKILNNLFIKILYFEAILLPYLKFPFGISIIIVAEKQNKRL